MIIYFDGVCGLCNGFVDFILKVDKKELFKFSPLQSEYAQTHLPTEYTSDLKTIVVTIDGKNYKKARAVIEVMKRLPPPYNSLGIFKGLPERVLNGIYDQVAKNRYKIFGKKESCRIPTPEERSRFLT